MDQKKYKRIGNKVVRVVKVKEDSRPQIKEREYALEFPDEVHTNRSPQGRIFAQIRKVGVT
jgi:hypothetical protein